MFHRSRRENEGGGGGGGGEVTRGKVTLNYLGKRSNTKNEARRWRKSNEFIDACCVDNWNEAF